MPLQDLQRNLLRLGVGHGSHANFQPFDLGGAGQIDNAQPFDVESPFVGIFNVQLFDVDGGIGTVSVQPFDFGAVLYVSNEQAFAILSAESPTPGTPLPQPTLVAITALSYPSSVGNPVVYVNGLGSIIAGTIVHIGSGAYLVTATGAGGPPIGGGSGGSGGGGGGGEAPPPPGGFFMSPSGSDTTGTGTLSNPWRSIQKFIDTNPTPGSILYLRGGTYVQNQGGHTGEGAGDLIGTVSQPITIRNYPNEVPSFPNMPGDTITFRGNTTASTIGANYVVLDGIRFPGCSPDDDAVIVLGNAGDLSETAYLVKNVTIRNCFFELAAGLTNVDHAIGLVHGCEFITIEDCEFAVAGTTDADAFVIYSEPAALDVVIQRCIFHGYTRAPIQVWDYNTAAPTATIEIKHCTFKSNGTDIDLRYHSTALVQDCVFDSPSGSTAIYDPNDSADTTLDSNYYSQTLTATFGLTAGSSAINGAHDGSDAGAVDYGPPPAVADEFYISPAGNDSTGTGSISNPWKTVNKFATVAGPGDTLYCRGGTYTGTTRTTVSTNSGSSGNPITVCNYPGETPVFVGPGSGSFQQFLMLTGGVSYWVIDGLTFQNFKTGSSGVIYVGDASVSTHHHIIRNCTFTQLGEGTGPFNHCVYLSYYADDITVEDNVMIGTSSNTFDGCALNVGDHEPSPRRFLIQRNIIRGFQGNAGAIWINGNITDGSILHNTFMSPAQIFISLRNYATGDVTVRSNVGNTASATPINDPVGEGTGAIVSHNYWGQTLNANGSLQAGSPAIHGAFDGSDAGAIDYTFAGSDYPPDSLLTNTTPPTPPAIPAYLTPYVDATWGTTITRVSNVNYQRNIYSRTAGWNSDQSMILLSGYNSAPAAVINGSNYAFMHNLPHLVGMGQWANTNPNKIYGTWVGENYLRSQTYTGGSSWTLDIEHTFTGYTSVTLGDNEGGMSDDDDTFVLMTQTAGGTHGMLVYDRSSNSVVATHSFGASGRPDTAFVSRSGNYVLVYWANGDGTNINQGLWQYDRNLNLIRQLTPHARHGDVARLANGTEVWAQVAFGGEYYRLDTGAHAYIFGTGQPYPYNNAFTVGHLSGRAVNRNGWVYLSQYNYPATFPGSTYGRDQVVAAKLDTTGTVEVFAWSHHRANGDTAAGYPTSPFATPSRDGKKVLFGSEWGDLTEPYGPVYAYVAEQL